MSLFLILIISFIFTGLVTIYGSYYSTYFSRDAFKKEIQSSHDGAIPRLGGISILLLLITSFFLGYSKNDLFSNLLISSLPIFLAGLLDDLKIISKPIVRFSASILSSILFIYLSNFYISTTSIFFLETLLNFTAFAIVLTVFASSGVINSFNFIDGLNGLTILFSIIISFVLYFVTYEIIDTQISEIALVLLVILLGVILFNFPYPKIFLGDSGAYLLGHMLFWLSIVFSETNTKISQWSILLLFMYPITETIISVIRRLKHKTLIYMPDRYHIHTLIYDKIVSSAFKDLSNNSKNNLSSIITIILASPPIILGYSYIFDSLISMYCVFASFIVYLLLYIFLSSLKT